jgi:drug/metabolite transporter (DMT)-like permease
LRLAPLPRRDILDERSMRQGPNNPTRLDPLGAAYCAAAAMFFACKGIFAKKLYALGVSVDAVVMIRGVIALPMFWVLALRREPLRHHRRYAVARDRDRRVRWCALLLRGCDARLRRADDDRS